MACYRSGGGATPESLTVTRICLFSDHGDVMAISRIPSVSFIASMLLTMKIIASRCYIRDPDGYIIELGQSTDLTNG